MPIPSPTYPKARARKKPPMGMALPSAAGNPQAGRSGFSGIQGMGLAKPPAAQAAGVAPPKGIPGAAPQTTPIFGQAPHSAQGDTIRNDAQTAMTGANTNWHDAVFRAVMGLG